jgi:nitroreductase
LKLDEVLTRRRACRDYLRDPVPATTLAFLADAAQRASTASNVPYRHVMIVDDPRVIRAVKQLHAALLADPPALLVLFTDVRLAVKRVGRVGLLSSAIDSGAAGENVWLAATDLGLGTQFTMISAMAGIRRILGLPDHFRVDLIMPIGSPDPDARPRRVRRTVPSVHHNQYGRLEPAS